MGLLSKIIAAKATSKVVQKMNERSRAAPQGEYIPAGRTVPGSTGTGLQSTANAALNRAGEFYKQNPKMVAGLGVAAALMALSALKRRQF
ncbi:MAG TPA: hypothetical protein VM122_08405 [Usitatibacter sp.]|nr:hypothetical protein [Usitatibacter sp.]